MKRDELKDIIKECIIEEGFIDNIKENSKILKEMENWAKNSRMILYCVSIKKDIDIKKVLELIEIHDQNLDKWLSKYKSIYNREGYKSLYNGLIQIKQSPKYKSQTSAIELDKNAVNKKYRELLQALRKSLNKIKSSDEFKNKCKDKTPKIHIEEFEYFYYNEKDKHGESVIEVIDEDQETRIKFSWILDKLVKYIKDDYNELYKIFQLGTGDGDEGCIYVEIYTK